ncbi:MULTISPECIES: BREX-2 system phosphatase PglZ [unclassified Micromonospora]|uniref:BREX-2 system phosphatase PglZ n=1 Tax=unclassified Micromonospora TaxID=2617518 RepID=UPI003A8914C9
MTAAPTRSTATPTPPGRPDAVRPDAVRRKVAAWLKEDDGTDAIALRAAPVWDSDAVIVVGRVRLRVVACPTPLAARAALHDRADDEKLVLLTDLPDAVLGDGLLAHLSRQSVRSVNAWELVRQMFGGVRLDPSLPTDRRWLPAALADHAPVDGWPTPPGTILTRDHALRCLTAELLGVDRDQLDASGLLQWTTDAQAQQRFTDRVAADVADGITAYLRDVAGPIAEPVMAAVRAGHGVDVIPIGLLAEVLWPTPAGGTAGRPAGAAASGPAGVEVAVARTRLEPRFGALRMTPVQAAALHDAADAWVARALDSDDDMVRQQGLRLVRRAEAIAADIELTSQLAASSLLPAGVTWRLRAFAAAVHAALPPPGAPAAGTVTRAGLNRAEAAFKRLTEHRAADQGRRTTAHMALRLLRWLSRPAGQPPRTLYAALQRQVTVDGWVDRARLDVFAGDVDPEVAEAYQALHRAVDARRARHDEQFAGLLAEATRADAEPGRMLRVEDVLDRVVAPILDAGRQALLLVMDGMGVAAATELAESLTRDGSWIELTQAGGPRAGVLAALPTVTEASRCSLLSGQLAVGDRQTEQSAFEGRFTGGRLLHKNSLRAGAGAAIDPEVRAAIDDPAVPVVAAVVNTIDDSLGYGEPGSTVWGQDTVPAVRDLLAVARHRVVVIVSDHGHVVDRGPEAVTLPGGDGQNNRWRPVTSSTTDSTADSSGDSASDRLGDGETVVTGRRVLLGGGTVVLPWREELRYGPRKAGYHGGAAPAEAVIPLLMFTAGNEESVPDWQPAPVASPDWWREPVSSTAQPGTGGGGGGRSGTGGRRAGKGGQSAKPVQTEQLFDVPADPQQPTAAAPPVAAPADADRALIDRLLASERYAQRRNPRTPLDDDRVAALLRVLLAGNGRAGLETLAAQAGVPAHRIQGTVTALRRLLQVEGYPVLTIDADGQTVVLDRPLLVEQFDLGESS